VIPRWADLFLSIMEAVVMEALGEDGFARLVAAFYRRVREDDLIGPMYPPDDWENAERRLADFLIFRFGGSDRYIQERGHPRLRMRHVPFSIGEAERDRWLELMGGAMDEMGLAGEARVKLGAFFDQVADFMRNREE
jgi:hemoglobin